MPEATTEFGTFVERETFSLPSEPRMDAGDERIVLGAGDELVVVTPTRRNVVDLDGRVDAVAAGRYAFAVLDGTLRAFTDGGVTLWSTSIDDAVDVVATDGDVAVRTAEDRLVGIDGETGNVRFEYDLPYPDLETEGIFAAEGGFLAAIWTYLVRVDVRGQEVFEENLDGAIASVGTLGDRAVVALKDGTLQCLESDGRVSWQRDAPTTTLTASGTSPLVAVGEGTIQTVTPDGELTPLSLPKTGAVAATDGLESICIADGAEIALYRRLERDPTSLEAAFDGADLSVDEPVRCRLENTADERVTTSIRLEIDDASVAAPERTIDVAPGEEREVTFEIEGVDATGIEETTATLYGGRRELLEERLSVSGLDPREPLSATVGLARIEGGTATVELRVENEGSSPIEDVTATPPGRTLGTLAGGESTTIEQRTSFVPGREIEITVTGRTTAETYRTTETLRLPDAAVEVEVDRSDAADEPWVAVDVRNPSAVEVLDTVAIETPTVTFEREATVPAEGTWTVVVALGEPIVEPFVVSVAIEGLEVRSETQFAGWDASSVHDRPDAVLDSPDAVRDRSDAGRDRSDAERERASADRDRESVDESAFGSGEAPRREPAGLSIERQVSDDRIAVDRLLEERLRIENDGTEAVSDATLSVGPDVHDVPTVPPGGTVDLYCDRIFRTPGEKRLPGGTLEYDGEEVSIESRSVEVRPAPLRVSGTLSTPEGRCSVAVRNEADAPSTIDGVAAVVADDEPIVWEDDRIDDLRQIPPGATRRVELELPDGGRTLPDRSAVRGGIRPAAGDTVRTLFPIGESADADPEPDSLSLSVRDGTVVDGEYGELVVELRNDTGTDLTDVDVRADGDALSSLMYAPESYETLPAGEFVTHRIDVQPDGIEATTFEVVVEASAGGDRRTEEWTLSGPVAASKDNWDDDTLRQWAADADEGKAAEDSSATGPIFEEPVATGYYRR